MRLRRGRRLSAFLAGHLPVPRAHVQLRAPQRAALLCRVRPSPSQFKCIAARDATRATNTDSSSNNKNDTSTKRRQSTRSVHVRRPASEAKLLHNVKLIGTRASDSLFNMLFLACKIHLVQARNFYPLGLMAAVSNQGHVLVLKLTSPKLLGLYHDDNLYRRMLIEALRDTCLLRTHPLTH
jgi:hypothetical protein